MKIIYNLRYKISFRRIKIYLSYIGMLFDYVDLNGKLMIWRYLEKFLNIFKDKIYVLKIVNVKFWSILVKNKRCIKIWGL